MYYNSSFISNISNWHMVSVKMLELESKTGTCCQYISSIMHVLDFFCLVLVRIKTEISMFVAKQGHFSVLLKIAKPHLRTQAARDMTEM